MNLDPTKATIDWQCVDSSVGLVMPWYTHGCLKEILTWDLKDKTVFEWGGGCSSLWWAKKAKYVYTREAHQEWADWIRSEAAKRGLNNLTVECCWPDPAEKYLDIPCISGFDVYIVDGSSRSDCIKKALTLPRPFTLIVDNWQQEGVYTDPCTEELLKPYNGEFFVQPDHKDKWTTAVWHL